MNNRETFFKQLSEREYLRVITHLPFIEKHLSKFNKNILELSNNNLFLTNALTEEQKRDHNIQRLNFSTHFYEMEKTLKDSEKQNIYSLVFCFLYTDFIHYQCDMLLEYIYYVLRPSGQLILTHPTNKTPTIATYKQVLDTKRFPFLDEVVNVHDKSFENVKEKLSELPFADVNIKDYFDKVTLPDLDTFKRYLHETAFLYKKVTPSEISNEIIEMQVAFFDEYCQIHFNGEYVFQFTLKTIKAIK